MSSPCATCTERCCHHYLVTVSGYDAWLIATSMRLAPEQFLVPVKERETTGGGFLLSGEGPTYDIALDKAPARSEEKPCVFWVGVPGRGGRCGIYPVRPRVCQTYPAYLHDGQVARREDVLCPTAAWRDGTLQHPAWRRRLEAMRVEYDIYRLVVACWNDHVRRTPRPELLSFVGYCTYLLEFYDRLAGLRAAMPDAEWDALCACWSERLQAGDVPLSGDVPGLRPWAWFIDAVIELGTGFFAAEPVSRAPEPISLG
jgi:Fe-S-cluster containining protein